MHKPSALGAQRMSAAEVRRLRAQPCWTQVRFAVVQLDVCISWGLCDTGAANTLPVEVSHAG